MSSTRGILVAQLEGLALAVQYLKTCLAGEIVGDGG
jgi:hypothetical protein